MASPKQWQAIIAAKGGPCRICGGKPSSNGHQELRGRLMEFHHLISRAQGGDDVEDNIVPLCSVCHPKVTAHWPAHLADLFEALTDSEYAYVVGKLGESGPKRLFGVPRFSGYCR